MHDVERFTLEWTKAQPTVAGDISSLTPDFHQAEDILQRAALALIRKLDEYDREKPFVVWAIGVARLEVLKSRRGIPDFGFRNAQTALKLRRKTLDNAAARDYVGQQN